MPSWVLAVPRTDGEAARRCVDAAGWLDPERRCGVLGAVTAQCSSMLCTDVGIPITTSGADFLTVCDTLLIADDAVSVREAQRTLCDLIATHSYFVIFDEHDVVCPLFHQRHRDPGTGGPRAIARLVEALESVLERNATSAASEASRLSPAERVALLVPGSPGGVPRRIEWLGPGLLMLPHDALTHPAWLYTLTSYVRHGDLRDSRHGDADGQSNDVRAVDAECVTVHRSAEVWDVVANVFGADRVARAARVDAGCTRRSHVEMLKSVSEPGAWQ